MGVSTMFLRYAYTNIPFIYRVSTVYLSYIYRISTVVDSELIAGRAWLYCHPTQPKYKKNRAKSKLSAIFLVFVHFLLPNIPFSLQRYCPR